MAHARCSHSVLLAIRMRTAKRCCLNAVPPCLQLHTNGSPPSAVEGMGFCAPRPAGGTFGTMQYLQVTPSPAMRPGLPACLHPRRACQWGS